ncbi:unnamed protein product [Strongylus vulgaris]|uniref:Uncharacterized protein n=1 Tax=Strongylus vulgaris TaxID=40348 RepID=A0A3P7IJS0_STRVU|nr:unnamed protein product [Strongylus vulgaris]
MYSAHVTKQRNSPNDLPKPSLNAEDEPILRPPPPPPLMPTPPEEPESMFNSWIVKEQRGEHSPPVSFFNPPSASSRHDNYPLIRKSHPFNGPVIRDHLTGRFGGPILSHSPPDESRNIWQVLSLSFLLLKFWKYFFFKAEPAQGISSRVSTENRTSSQPSPKEDDPPCSRDTVPMIGKLPSKIIKKKEKVDTNAIQTTDDKRSVPALPIVQSQSKIAEPKLERVKKIGKAKNKGKKKKMCAAMRHGYNIRRGPAPFNGPVPFFGSAPSIIQEAEAHPAETIRTRFSSSPLPWHRGEAANECNAWEHNG